MPELPEVETVRMGLKRLLPGLKITKVEHDWPKSFPNARADVDKFLVSSTVMDVRRRAKVLMIDLSTGYSLVIHLKMTGQLVFVRNPSKQGLGLGKREIGKKNPPLHITQPPTPIEPEARFGAGHPNDSLIGELPDKSTRVVIIFEDGEKLYFNDQRKFGWMRLMPTIEIPNIDFMRKVGPEPLEPEFSANNFINRLQRRKNSNIKAVLLDQTVIAGVGNIYADESLFAAKIHPNSIVGEVPQNRLKVLYNELRAVLFLSIEKGGSTDRNYVDAEGRRGSYIDFAMVFRKDKQQCQICGHEIIKIRVAGRGTHVCPHCQKLYKGSEN